jgi:hypothetical protein
MAWVMGDACISLPAKSFPPKLPASFDLLMLVSRYEAYLFGKKRDV